MNKHLLLLSILLTTTFTLHAHANDGGVDGGGGCTIQRSGSTQLLDYAVNGSTLPSNRTGVQLRAPRNGIARVDEQSLTPLKRFIEQRLNLWESNSPVLVAALRSTVASLPFFVTSSEFNFSTETCPQRGVPGEVNMVIAYQRNFGAVISAPGFNNLDFLSQAGIIVHEALRLLQVQEQQTLSDSEIQNLTHALMMTAPSTRSIEASMNGYVADIRGQTERLFADARALCREAVTRAGVYSEVARACSQPQTIQTAGDALLDFAQDGYDTAISGGDSEQVPYWRNFMGRAQSIIDRAMNIRMQASSMDYAAINVAAETILIQP